MNRHNLSFLMGKLQNPQFTGNSPIPQITVDPANTLAACVRAPRPAPESLPSQPDKSQRTEIAAVPISWFHFAPQATDLATVR
jgi:hypothetical protein